VATGKRCIASHSGRRKPPTGFAGILRQPPDAAHAEVVDMIRKLSTGQYRLYSRKLNPKTGRRRNLGTFATRAAAEKHEREVQYFKRH
jgi:hypothetical protein